jgi:hypothetical protein
MVAAVTVTVELLRNKLNYNYSSCSSSCSRVQYIYHQIHSYINAMCPANIGSSQFEEHILIGASCIGRCAAYTIQFDCDVAFVYNQDIELRKHNRMFHKKQNT